MARRWGLGPVFESEWLTVTRRWQIYAGRSMFVGILLLALASVWGAPALGGVELTIRDMANVGRGFYGAIVVTQLTLVLIAAPAATAGAICQDKSRGNLVQLLMTDLSNAEIVLGKLAGRLVPVLAMLGCTLPVLTLCTLLGGIDPMALFGAFAICLSVAVLGCSIALSFSIWGTRPHEVLLATFAVLAVWLLTFPVWEMFTWMRGFPALPRWAIAAHPFFLALRQGKAVDYLGFTLGALTISAILIAVSIVKVRSVIIGQADAPTARRPARRLAIFGLGEGPSLDSSPVLWYEWHRKHPTPWIRNLIRIYFLLAIGFSLIAIEDSVNPTTTSPGWFAAFVNAFQVAMGLPLLLIAAATALVEERSRGSLDILLTTPLSSRSVVLAKWWSVYRELPRLLWLPTLVGLVLAGITEKWLGLLQLVLFITVITAAWTSIGLALSTWISRLSRAIAAAVILYTLASLGLPMLFLTMLSSNQDLATALAEVSPFHGLFDLTYSLGAAWWFPIVRLSAWIWIVLYAIVAVVLLLTLLATFDHALGRIPEKPRRPPKPEPTIIPRLVGASPADDPTLDDQRAFATIPAENSDNLGVRSHFAYDFVSDSPRKPDNSGEASE
ncbi:ABC transporter permease [Singulisphaera sp. PoT]|uniref:ABC transporter permease n=1 Tax=Singulisphaera sp. PoT TaxID=3411797 RepID=UPI003BF57A03